MAFVKMKFFLSQNFFIFYFGNLNCQKAGSKGGDNGQLIQYKSYQRKGMKSSLIQ